jgi:hypothetical protein
VLLGTAFAEDKLALNLNYYAYEHFYKLHHAYAFKILAEYRNWNYNQEFACNEVCPLYNQIIVKYQLHKNNLVTYKLTELAACLNP